MAVQLRETEEGSYKAAGILPIAFFRLPPPGCLSEHPIPPDLPPQRGPIPYTLIGTELRVAGKKSSAAASSSSPVLNVLGGKREGRDQSAAHTAWREFWEESGRLLSDQEEPFLEHCLRGGQQRRVLWFAPGKYALFIHHLPYPAPQWTMEIVEAYSRQEIREEGSEMMALHWLPIPALLEAVRQYGFVYDTNGQPYSFSRFSAQMLLFLSQYLKSLVDSQPGTLPPSA